MANQVNKDAMRYPELAESMIDQRGRLRTNSLFREGYIDKDHLEPVYTLKENDPRGELPSLRKLYFEIADPTEYEFALAAFGSWNHWLRVKKSRLLVPYLEDWPIELEVKLRSEALKAIKNEVSNGKAPFNAAKFLAKKEWLAQTKRGRPSKEEVERELKIAAKVDAEVGEDAARLGLAVINGDK